MKNTLFTFIFLFLVSGIYSQTSIQAHFGIAHTYRQLVSDQDPLSNTVVNIRNESERPEWNYNFGLGVNLPVSQKVFIKTGFGLSYLGYLVKEDEDLQWPSEHDGMGGFINDPNLPMHLKISEDYIFLTAPLQLRYEFQKEDRKWTPYLEGGVLLNIYLTTQTITTTDGERSTTQVKNGKIQIVQPSTQAAIGLQYRMSEKMQVFLQGEGNYFIDTLTETPVSDRLYGVGINTGLRWQF